MSDGEGSTRRWHPDGFDYADDAPRPPNTFPRSPVPPGEPFILQRITFPGFEHLPDFDLRNGEASDARPLVVRATIPETFHWTPIGGLDHRAAVSSIDAFVRSAYYQIETRPDGKLTESQRRKAAIILGVSRAVMTQHYRLAPGDFIGGELANPVLNAYTTEDGGTRVMPTVALNDPKRDILVKPLEYTDLEKSAVSALLMSSMGALPLAGYSLIMTGHHYLSDAGGPSKRAYGVVEKQFWKSNAVAEFFTTDMEMVQDMCWHKAGHPVSMNLKQDFASDPKIATMLRDAGVGSAASRLPALEPQMRAASSYVALMDSVAPLFQMFGGDADASALAEVIMELKLWKRGDDDHAIPAEWPGAIKSRDNAITWLGDILQRNAPKVAYCYGFYCALSEQTQMMGAAGGGDSLRTSFSLSKLRSVCHSSFIEGGLSYGDFTAARNRKKMAGEFTAVKLVLSIE